MIKNKIFYLFVGLLIGCLFPIQSLFADQPIKLIINGKTINCEVPPTIINGRTMVMARDIVENLGGQVAWDNDNRAVVITGGIQTNMAPSDLPNINNQSTIISNPVQITPEKDNPKPPQMSDQPQYINDDIDANGNGTPDWVETSPDNFSNERMREFTTD